MVFVGRTSRSALPLFGAIMLLASWPFVPAMSEDTRRLDQAFAEAYLYDDEMPRRPAEMPVHRWESSWKIFYDDADLQADMRQAARTELNDLTEFVRVNTNIQSSYVDSEADANIVIIYTTYGNLPNHITTQRLLEKYFGGWGINYAGFVASFVDLYCVSSFFSATSGPMKAGILLIKPDNSAQDRAICLRQAVSHVLGFEGRLSGDWGPTIFSALGANTKISPLDVALLHALYGENIRAGTPVWDAIRSLHGQTVRIQ